MLIGNVMGMPFSRGKGHQNKVVVFDDFNRQNGSPLGVSITGQQWNDIVGTWSINNGKATTANNNAITLINTGFVDYKLNAKISAPNYDNTRSPNVLFRTLNDNNRLAISFYLGNINLSRLVDGTSTTLASVPFNMVGGIEYNVEIICSDSNVRVIVDDVQRIDYYLSQEDTTRFTEQNYSNVGFRAGGNAVGLTFDDIKVERL